MSPFEMRRPSYQDLKSQCEGHSPLLDICKVIFNQTCTFCSRLEKQTNQRMNQPTNKQTQIKNNSFSAEVNSSSQSVYTSHKFSPKCRDQCSAANFFKFHEPV